MPSQLLQISKAGGCQLESFFFVLANNINAPNVLNTTTTNRAASESSGTGLDDFGVEEAVTMTEGDEEVEEDGVLEDVEVGAEDGELELEAV